MFNNSKYTKWYFSIIKNRQMFPLDDSTITEKHHIIPKSLKGSNDDSNLVCLTIKEHFVCHLLLTKMCITKKQTHMMLYALDCMSNGFGVTKRHTGKIHESTKIKIRQMRSENMTGELNHFYGKTHKEESKCYGEKNATKRIEVRNKISNSRKGILPHNHYNGWDDETKTKISKSLMGHVRSEESRKKQSESKQNLIWVHNKKDKPKQIKIDIFPEYELLGYVRGRGPKEFW